MSSMDRVQTADGILAGTVLEQGVRLFCGIPFANPPLGELRWQPPQPVEPWEGLRSADEFGCRPMQLRPFGDMQFRSPGISEDCLYLNVWTPAEAPDEGLPVLVYFYGGGNIAGDSSEPRYDGTSMAQRGIVAVTVNYRLGVFGFFAHPELSSESPHGASGNYGYMDQQAALAWVRENIAAFGGDPERVTIAGESAGSLSVSVQMTSPLSIGLFSQAIGESGAAIPPTLAPMPLDEAEQEGLKVAESLGASSLTELRAIPAEALLEATGEMGFRRATGVVDGYFLPKAPVAVLAAGEQARVPLLVGWNSQEADYPALLGEAEPTVQEYERVVKEQYGDLAEEVLRLYPAETSDEVMESAAALAADRFIAYSTWKWCDLHAKTGGQPVYRYLYCRPRPPMRPEFANMMPGLAGGVIERDTDAPPLPAPRGAVHSAEIEYALGNLPVNDIFSWTDDDFAVSRTMQAYFANFIKTGDPNGPDLPQWPRFDQSDPPELLCIDVRSEAIPEENRSRFEFHDRLFNPDY